MEEKPVKWDYVRSKRALTLVILDLFAINFSALAALLVRFEFSITALEESEFVVSYLKTAPVYSVVSILLFTLFHLYQSLWSYASIDELRYIIFSALAAAVAEIAVSKVMGVYLPRSMPILNLLFLFLALTLIRYFYRIARRMFRKHDVPMRRTMLIGAGAAGAMVLWSSSAVRAARTTWSASSTRIPAKKNTLLGRHPGGGRSQLHFGTAAADYHVTGYYLRHSHGLPERYPPDHRDLSENRL